MCNLYSMTRNQDAIRKLFKGRHRQPAVIAIGLSGQRSTGYSRGWRRADVDHDALGLPTATEGRSVGDQR